MSERDKQFLRYYQRHRIEEQGVTTSTSQVGISVGQTHCSLP